MSGKGASVMFGESVVSAWPLVLPAGVMLGLMLPGILVRQSAPQRQIAYRLTSRLPPAGLRREEGLERVLCTECARNRHRQISGNGADLIVLHADGGRSRRAIKRDALVFGSVAKRRRFISYTRKE